MSNELLATLPTFVDIVRYRALRGDYAPVEELPGGLDNWVAQRFERFNLQDLAPPERRRTTTGKTVEVTYRRLSDGRVLTIHRDITDIVEQEERLKAARAESERTREILQSVLDNMTDGVMLFDKDFRWQFINRQLMEFQRLDSGVAYPGASGYDILRFQARRGDFGPCETDADVDATVQERADKMLTPGGIRYERRTASGRIVEFNFRPMPDGGVLGLLSRRHRAARERAGGDQGARPAADGDRQHGRRRDAGRPGPSAGRWTATAYASSSACRATSPIWAPIWARSVRFQMARGDFTEGREAVARRVQALREGGHAHYVRRTAAGRFVEFRSRGLTNGEVLFMYRDITELKEQQAEVERARDEAEAANQAKSTFLATMSHEIRTPMNGVVGTAELLAREALNDRQKRLVNTVRSSAASLLRIIDDVLDFSKIEAGRMELEEAPCSLRTLVEGTVETLSVQVGDKGLAINATVEPGTPDALLADATRLRQILFNLVAMPSSSPTAARSASCPRRADRQAGDDAGPHGERHRHRHERRAAVTPLQALLPGRQLDDAALRRHGPRPFHRAPAGPAHGRRRHRRKHTRQGIGLHHHRAREARLGNADGGAGRRRSGRPVEPGPARAVGRRLRDQSRGAPRGSSRSWASRSTPPITASLR